MIGPTPTARFGERIVNRAQAQSPSTRLHLGEMQEEQPRNNCAEAATVQQESTPQFLLRYQLRKCTLHLQEKKTSKYLLDQVTDPATWMLMEKLTQNYGAFQAKSFNSTFSFSPQSPWALWRSRDMLAVAAAMHQHKGSSASQNRRDG